MNDTFKERLAQSLKRLRKGIYLSAASPKRIAPAMYEDLTRVKLAYMAEHPEDDDEPITEEWLTQVGDGPPITLDGRLAIVIGYQGDSGDPDVFIQCFPRDEEEIYFHVCADYGEDRLIPNAHPKTRGDLRRLCAALGVELKERTDE